MTPNVLSDTPIVKTRRVLPAIAKLLGHPGYPTAADGTETDWLHDPRFSVEHFKQFGGREAVAELMRKNAEGVDGFGLEIPVSLVCYRDFICDRASLVGKEKDEVYSRWAADHPEGVPTFDKVEDYMLSAASFAEKLDAMQKANLLMEEVMRPRLEKEREERERRAKEYMEEQARAPFKKEIDRTKGAQAGADRAKHKVILELKEVEKERDYYKREFEKFKHAFVKATVEILQLKGENKTDQPPSA